MSIDAYRRLTSDFLPIFFPKFAIICDDYHRRSVPCGLALVCLGMEKGGEDHDKAKSREEAGGNAHGPRFAS